MTGTTSTTTATATHVASISATSPPAQKQSNKKVQDSDDVLGQHEKRYYQSAGLSKSEIESLQAKKRAKEEIAVCKQMMRQCGMLVFQTSHGSLEINLQRRRRRRRNYDDDQEAEQRNIVLCYAAALDRLGRTMDASKLLESYLGMHPTSSSESDSDDDAEKDDKASAHQNSRPMRQPQGISHVDNIPVTLALAKLYFKVQKDEAMDLCASIQNHVRRHLTSRHKKFCSSDDDLTGCCSLDDAADAYHLAGWVCIHADDHTAAYRIWQEGFQLLPTCSILERQARKRRIWDQPYFPTLIQSYNDHYLGKASGTDEDEVDLVSDADRPSGPILFDAQRDFIAYSVPPHLRAQCPALALFDQRSQNHQLVFCTHPQRPPLLSASECARVLQEVHDYHAPAPRHGQWGTVRHSSVRTTDVAAEDIPALRPWLRALLAERLYPMLACVYPTLADGSSTLVPHPDNNVDASLLHGTATTPVKKDETPPLSLLLPSRMRVHDAFIVRYDAESDMSLSLPEHSDTSVISFTVALNQRNVDFVGGGTWFESISSSSLPTSAEKESPTGAVIEVDQGHAVAFAGPLRHAGYPVTKGTRIILVLFLYCQDFAYGKYLKEYVAQHGEQCGSSIVGTGFDTDSSETNATRSMPSTTAEQQATSRCINDAGPGTGTLHDPQPETKNTDSTTRPSGDQPGGFVVYNQTVELVSMLNRRVASILDD